MKKTFKAPPMADVKPKRAAIEGRPLNVVQTSRVHAIYERKGNKSFFDTKRMINEGHKYFFSKRPELHFPA